MSPFSQNGNGSARRQHEDSEEMEEEPPKEKENSIGWFYELRWFSFVRGSTDGDQHPRENLAGSWGVSDTKSRWMFFLQWRHDGLDKEVGGNVSKDDILVELLGKVVGSERGECEAELLARCGTWKGYDRSRQNWKFRPTSAFKASFAYDLCRYEKIGLALLVLVQEASHKLDFCIHGSWSCRHALFWFSISHWNNRISQILEEDVQTSSFKYRRSNHRLVVPRSISCPPPLSLS